MNQYPRVLHLGYYPIGFGDNSGLTLASLFADWPRDSLMQLCFRTSANSPSDSRIVVAPPSVTPLDWAARKLLGRSLGPGAIDGLNAAISRKGRVVSPRLRLRLAASAVNDLGPVYVSPKLIAELRDFGPEVIHTLLGGVRPMRLAARLAEALSVPIVPHFMDDWMDTLYADGQLAGLARWAAESTMRNVLKHVPLSLTIGEDMQLEYSSRLGHPCVSVGNSVDLDMYAGLARPVSIPGARRTLRYVGGLHLGRSSVLSAVATALADSADTSSQWVLEVFAPVNDSPVGRELEHANPNVRFRGSLPPGDVAQALVDADALVFIESSDAAIHRFTRLSVSTKVPQYLATGRPILVVGPSDQSSVRTLLQGGTGHYGGTGTDGPTLGASVAAVAAASNAQPTLLTGERRAWLEDRFGVRGSRERLRDSLLRAARAESDGIS